MHAYLHHVLREGERLNIEVSEAFDWPRIDESLECQEQPVQETSLLMY